MATPDLLERARMASAKVTAPTRAAAPQAPDPGEVLAEVPRGDGTVLRVAWRTFEGKPFATIAVWERGTGGAWWPMKGRAVTVRVRELGEVLEGLVKAAERAAASSAGGAP